jgi:hypothetical protein
MKGINRYFCRLQYFFKQKIVEKLEKLLQAKNKLAALAAEEEKEKTVVEVNDDDDSKDED